MRRRLELAEERGAIMILMALALPFVLIGFTILAVDVSNWWVHKRHLQTQADAAALAGATKYRYPGCTNGVIEATAIEYSGGRDPENPGVEPDLNKNPQVGGTPVEEVHTLINEAVPYGRTAADYEDPDFAGLSEAESAPCEMAVVDVKMTETNLPWFLKTLGITEFIDAQARVVINRLTGASGLLPLGVEEVNPKRVRVEVWDEDADERLGASELCLRTTIDAEGNTVPVAEDGLLIWDNKVDNACPDLADPDAPPIAAVPLALDMREETINGDVAPKHRLGVRVIVSGSESVTCGEQLVLCYGTGTDGLTRIRGYLGSSSTSIVLGEVALIPTASCAEHDNGYFSTACATETIQVDLQGLTNAGTPKVTAKIQWKNGTKSVDLTYDDTLPNGPRWVGEIPVDPVGDGTRKIDISWKQTTGSVAGTPCGNKTPPPCEGEYLNVHKVFSGARAVSGPIKELRVDVGANLGVNNVPRCSSSETCPQAFTFKIGLGGRNQLAKIGAPPISLRFFGRNSSDPSQSQALDCDPATNSGSSGWTLEVVNGCTPGYTINTGDPCPPTAPALWASGQPWDCVATQTGNFKIAEAFNERIMCRPPNSAGNCPDGFGRPIACTNPNNWPNWAADDPRWASWQGIDAGDPRIVPLFLVPFGTFNTSGTGIVPVIDFAFFYVTGWTSQGGEENPMSNPCPKTLTTEDNGDAFEAGTENDNAAISGHFMKYTGPVQGGVGEGACDFESISGCLAVMTK